MNNILLGLVLQLLLAVQNPDVPLSVKIQALNLTSQVIVAQQQSATPVLFGNTAKSEQKSVATSTEDTKVKHPICLTYNGNKCK